MKTFYSFIAVIIISIISFVSSAQAQLTGIKTIKSSGGDYATFTAAINDLNSSGVGAGGVIFNVDAGFTVTELCPIITATGTSANPIVFQKTGAGANPKITAGTGTSTADGIIRLSGGDYITFDGIDVSENSANSTATTRMEYGFYIYNASATNGAQYNTIKNCKITLNRLQTTSRALLQSVYYAPSSIEGANSYNKFQSVVIENSYQGIYVTGNATYPDLDMEISNCTIGASTANDIGNGSATINGIRMTYIKDANIFGNEVRNLTVTGAVVPYGIYLESLQGTCNIYNNKVHDIKSTSTSVSSIIYGIRADINATNICNIYNNFVYELYHGIVTASATIVIRGITVGLSGTGTGNVYYNSVRIGEDAKPSSAAMYVGNTANTVNIKNNIFANFSTAGATSLRYCIYRGNGSILNDVDYNDYYIDVAGTNNYVGYFTANCNTLDDWRTASSGDANSVSGNPYFTSATDLHISTSTATLVESGGTPISGITTDIDGNTRNLTTPDIGADEGNFMLPSKTVDAITINQASIATVFPSATNQEILRIDVSVIGRAGTLPLNSINVNSSNTRDEDVLSAKLYRTSTATFSTENPLGTESSFLGGIASFSSLNYDLPSSITYLWVVYDIAPDAVEGNTLDAKILVNNININGSTYPSSIADPAGSRTIISGMEGIYTVDPLGSGTRNYTTFTSALTDLNYRQVIGAVTFNVAAGFTENITSSLAVTRTGTSSNTITFQKDPATSGANPVITRTDAGALTTSSQFGHGDAIIILEGSDYITFNGIDVTASDQGIEYGYYIIKANGANACKNVNIKNCTVTMNKGTNKYGVGIYISNNISTSLVSSSTGVTVSSEEGRHYNIVLSGNTVQNTFCGIAQVGFNHTLSPYNYYDQNITIGTEGAGNIIQNFGGTGLSSRCDGVYTKYGNNIDISYNTINNVAGGGTGFVTWGNGVMLSATNAVNITISYNTISLGSTASNYVCGIQCNSGDASSTLNIHHNIFQDFSSTGSIYMIYGSAGTAANLFNLYSNTITNNTITGTGVATLFNLGTANTLNIYDNNISNFAIGGSTSTSYIMTMGAVTTANIYNNTISNITKSSGAGGSIIAINGGTGTNNNIYNNKINGITSTGTQTICGINITSGTNNKIYNNLIYDLNTADTSMTDDVICGISITSTRANSTLGIYYNTINLNATSGGANFWTSCIYHTGSTTSTTAALDMRNNILVNTSTPNGAGKTISFRRSASTDLNNYSTLSNNNLFYAGSPGVSNLIYYDGTNSYQTLADFKTAAGPTRETYSVSGDPGFTSSTNLIPNPSNSNSWILSGNGIHIAGITTDFAGTTRPTVISEGAPDIGAYEFTAGSTTPNSFEIVPLSGSNDVYINGRKLINLDFSNLGGITSINVKYYSGVNPPQTNGFPVMNGYIAVTQNDGSGFIYDITYYYSESQMGSIVSEADIRLSKSDNEGTNWDVYSVLGTGAGEYQLDNSTNTIKVHQLNSFSIFTNGSIDNPLPVQLSSFTYTLKGRDVSILWKTSSENNNSGFDIERMIKNGNKWEKIGFVSGKGTVNTSTNYLFEDRNLQSGKYKYRLKQIDVNGNFEYFALNSEVEIGIPKNFNLSQNYPNPFNPITKINFDLPENSKVDLRLYDLLGREVASLVNELKTAGYYTISFNASNLASGIYFYRMIAKSNAKDFVLTKKMMIVK